MVDRRAAIDHSSIGRFDLSQICLTRSVWFRKAIDVARKNNDGQKRAKKVQARKKKQVERNQSLQNRGSKDLKSRQTNERQAFADFPPQFLDRRLMERQLADLTGMDDDETDEQIEANDLYYEALESAAPRKRIKLLKQALQLNPRHIDARVALCEEVDDVEMARELLEQAISIGEEDLADELVDDVGEFWGLLHTRPYMRAQQALAEIEFHHGQISKAIEIYQELIRLNPMDNQGVRWALMEAYCRTNRHEEALKLVEQFPDEGAPFLPMTAVLIQYANEGDSPELRKQLQEQVDRNPHIIPRLLDPSLLNKGNIPMFSLGSPEEADLYCQQFLSVWKSTPGAVTWLRECSRELSLDLSENEDHDVKSENDSLRAEVLKLEQSADTWYFDVTDLGEDGWLYGVVDQFEGEVLAYEPGLRPFGRDTVLHALLLTMIDPDDGRPRRPSLIEFGDSKFAKMVKTSLKKLGITSEVTDERPEILVQMERMTPVPGQPLNIDIESLLQVPQSDAHWELDWRQLDQWVPEQSSGDPTQPYLTLVVGDDGMLLSQQLSLTPPDEEVILGVLSQAIEQTDSRPQQLCVRTADQHTIIRPAAEQLKIESSISGIGSVNELFDSLYNHMNQVTVGPPALVSLENVTPAMVGDFFEAAALFYRSKIWLSVSDQTIVEVRCPALIASQKYAIIMGQLGEEIGILFFDSKKSIARVFQLPVAESAQAASEIHGLSWSFGEKETMHPADVSAAKQFGWTVAAPEAWPSGFCVNNGSVRAFTAEELQLITAGTHAVLAQLQAKTNSLKSAVQLNDRSVEVSTKLSKL